MKNNYSVLHKMFEACAEKAPGHVALIACDRTMTYEDLNSEANRIAHGLMTRGLNRGERAVLLLPRRSFYFSALFGVLKTGAAFIPCDPAYPVEHILHVVNDSGASCLITTDEHVSDFPGKNAIKIEDLILADDKGNPVTDVTGNDAAYIIYTSGSTGKPKGVILPHRGISNFCTTDPQNILYALVEKSISRMLSITTVSFDLSLKDSVGILCNGKTVVFASESQMNDPRELAVLMEKYEVDGINGTPTRYQQYLKYEPFKNALKSLVLVMAGGEIFPMTLLHELQELRIPHVINTYGPTETTISSNMAELADADSISVGKPLLHYEEYIVDADLNPVPSGAAGELLIGGPGVAFGYNNLEKQTKERFIDFKGKRFFRSGDLARFDEHGNVVILGRMDSLVKLRGLRIELTSIEELMETMPGISRAVAAIKELGGHEQLCAYYTSENEVDETALKDMLKAHLTAYSIPAVFMRLDEIPMTANGKTDRKALPVPEWKGEEATPPQNDMQQKIFDIVSETLGSRDFGIETKLSFIGLTSLSSVSLSIELSRVFDVNVRINDFYENDTVEKLEKRILGLLNTEEVFAPQDDYALTKTQEGIFFETQSHPDTTIYNTPVYIELDASIETDRLKDAVTAAVAAHPYMMTRFFINENGEIRQHRVEGEAFTAAEIEDIHCEHIEETFGRLVRPFDLEKDRLFRFRIVFERSDNKRYFFLDLSHSISDGTSKVIFLKDVSRAYAGEVLTAEKYSGFEASLAEEKLRSGERYVKAKEYYTNLFDGCEPDCLPAPDVLEPMDGPGMIRMISSSVNPKEIAAFCASLRISENAFYTAAFGYTIAKYTGLADSVFTTVNNGRNDPRFADSVSMFVKTYPVICRTEDKSVADLLKETGTQLMDSLIYDAYSFEEMSNDLGIRGDLLFVWQGAFADTKDLFCGKACRWIEPELSEAKAGIDLQVFPDKETITIKCSYRKSLYTEAFIRGLIKVYERVLLEFKEKESLTGIELADDEELNKLDGFNQTEHDYEISDIVTLFRRQARSTPDNTAVVYQDQSYTYSQVDDISDRIAAYLKSKKLGLEDVVPVLIPRCEYMVLAAMGVLKAGALYQPLDPGYPPERLEFMISDTGAKLIIADRALMDRIPGYKGEVLFLDEIPGLPAANELPKGPGPENGFIVLYTSGSTGTPKGVILSHHNLCNYCAWYIKTFNVTEESRMSAYASFGFDCHMMDLYPALIAGGRVYVISEEIRLDFPKLQRYFDENRLTHSFMTTQVARQFAEFYTGDSLKCLIAAGEALAPVDTAGKSFTLYNGYGPTECTILATYFPVEKLCRRMLIGRPLDNYRVYIVDREMRRLPPGMPGELLISGHGVGRGYLNRPEKTSEVFIENPFTKEAGYGRVYRTGDVARFVMDGNVDFLGRGDSQVKIRGFRIELTEVESVIRDYPGINDVTVQAFDSPSGGKFLAAYIVSDREIEKKALADFIMESKPAYMVPEVIMQIDRIPLNQNHKVNRRALPEPVNEQKEENAEIARPMTLFEEEISNVVKKIIGEQDISPQVSLTHYGLTSISSIGLATKLMKHFHVEVPVQRLLEGASIIDIENSIYKKWREGDFGSADQGIMLNTSKAKREKRDSYPLTPVQLAVYYDAMKRESVDTLYNVPFCFAFHEIDAEKLADAVSAAIRAHSYLNTHIEVRDGAIVQVRDDNRKPVVSIQEMTGDDFDRFKASFVQPFNISTGPLYKAAVVKVSGDRTYLLIDFHHIVFDGFSESVFLTDIALSYSGEALTPPQYTFFDYALEEEEKKNSPAYDEAEKYFDDLMKNYEAPSEIPTDSSGVEENGALAVSTCEMNKNDVERLCRKLGVTPSALFLAASFYTVSRFAGSRQVYISTIDNGRSTLKLNRTVGMFVHTLPVAMDFEKEMTASELITRSAEVMRGSIRNEVYPFAEFAAKYGYSTRIMYEYQVGIAAGEGQIGAHSYESIQMQAERPKFPVSFTITDTEDNYQIAVRYNDAIYLPETMDSLAAAIRTCIARMTSDPSASVRKLSLTDENEERILEGFSKAETFALPETVFHRVFEKQAAERPDAVAVIARDKTLSYAELNSEANKVAHSLMHMGLKKGGSAVLLLPRRSYYFSAMFGVLKTGAAFIPCDPEYPPERIRHILHDSGASCIITTEKHMTDYTGDSVVDIRELLKGEDAGNPDAQLTGEDMAYMIYTSGSTGKPKGVMMKHTCVVNCVYPHPVNIQYYTIKNRVSAILGVTTVSFDMSFQETAGALLNGRTLVFADETETNDPIALAALFEQTGANCFDATPSRLMQYMEYEPFRKALGRCCLIMIGGEGIPQALLNNLQEILAPDALIVNTYGPTETTMACNGADMRHMDHVVAGKPLLNYESYIVDMDGNRLPRRAIGELLIGGVGVGIGYRNLPDLTAQKFITYNGKRVYRSGDFARWDTKGNVEILGRIDNQVKLRGLRIELSEIEGLMEIQPGIKRAVAAVRKINGQDNLCAWFASDEPVDIIALREEMKKHLTSYMVPVAFARLKDLPQTPNGKVDMKALATPQTIESGEYTAPVNEVEKFFCDLYAKVLGLEKVGRNDDFFACGGTSLTATSIMIKATEAEYPLTYGEVFKLKTPRALAAKFLKTTEGPETDASSVSKVFEDYDYSRIMEALSKNTIASFNGGKSRPIGNILLTGATGYMGTHVLHEYLMSETGKAFCIVRKGRFGSALERLNNMMFYYFQRTLDDVLDRVQVIDGDVTTYDTFKELEQEPIDTVFNCAANVKHFSSGTDIEDINIGGTTNALRFCETTGARLIHFSTTSVGGALKGSDPLQVRRLNEHSLYFGQMVDNQYISSKLMSERIVLEAVAERGADAKVIRVGTLAPRESDGEFQINFLTNSSMGKLRSYALIRCFPYSQMNNMLRLGPIDESARSFMHLAKTPKECCLFHAINNHLIPIMDVIRVMKDIGIDIEIVEDAVFLRAMEEAEKDPRKAAIFSSILAYKGMVEAEAVEVEPDCEYTSQILARTGFFWNETDTEYIRKYILGMAGLKFFDEDNLFR